LAFFAAGLHRTFGAAPDPWVDFDLASERIGGTTVYYDRSLADQSPIFEAEYSKFQEALQEASVSAEVRAAIIDEVDEILGIASAPRDIQEEMLRILVEQAAVPSREAYMVDRNRVKSYLRQGGTLPGFTYDNESDMAFCTFMIAGGNRNGPAPATQLVYPASPSAEFEKDTRAFFDFVSQQMAGGPVQGTMIHELVEVTLVHGARPKGVRGRWFNEGLGNVVAIEVMKRFLGDETATRFAAACSTGEYSDLETEVNLLSWPFKQYQIAAPIEREKRFDLARYAFSTREIQRLVDEHGLGCIREIVDKLKPEFREEGIFEAIETVTGEDMRQRLLRYRTFSKPEEGTEKYAAAFARAYRERNLEDAVFYLLRSLELRDDPFDNDGLKARIRICAYLCGMGYSADADAAMLAPLDLLNSDAGPDKRGGLIEGFLVYCLETNRPARGKEFAEELVKDHPESVPALTVMMLSLEKEGRLSEAREYASRIREIGQPGDSPALREAARILGTDDTMAPGAE